MPTAVEYYDDDSGVVLSVDGLVTGKEVIDVIGAVFSAKEKMAKHKYALMDYSGLTELVASNEEIATLVKMAANAGEIIVDGVVAIAAEKDLVFGLSRMWEILLGDKLWVTRVFRSRDEAILWLAANVRAKFGFDITVE